METCSYEKIGFVAGPTRMRYRSACGLDVVQLEHEGFDGIKSIRVDIEGLCMKCKKEIKVTSHNSESVEICPKCVDGVRTIHEPSRTYCRRRKNEKM